jgi:hypothetical protein
VRFTFYTLRASSTGTGISKIVGGSVAGVLIYFDRDLKLENFLFEDRDSNSPLILIDFGLSKTFEPGEILTQRVGSCYYTGKGCYRPTVKRLIGLL